jgi:hypothetical protein
MGLRASSYDVDIRALGFSHTCARARLSADYLQTRIEMSLVLWDVQMKSGQ